MKCGMAWCSSMPAPNIPKDLTTPDAMWCSSLDAPDLPKDLTTHNVSV